jgi:hypothetical protein
VLYRWLCAERLKLLLAMINGRGDDFAPTLNPSAGLCDCLQSDSMLAMEILVCRVL